MTLDVTTHGGGLTTITLTECPCGYEFDENEPRHLHFLFDHAPEDFGLEPRVATDGGEPR